MQKKRIISSYDKLYQKDNFRLSWEGEISLKYKIPKYVSLFLNQFKNLENLEILELGAGDGSITELIMKQLKYKRYIATEISEEGVKKLKNKNIDASMMDAMDLKFKDNSFDIVCSFDTMHHVDNPVKMAREMLRVTRKYFFLIEANGICILRKVYERLPKYKETGERSYTPKKYMNFFKSKQLKKISIKPFLYMVPFTPSPLIKLMIKLSETLEQVPILRWQGSSVLIYGEKFL
jgi:SAM-dependent methyltransferase|tara:strand:- start:1994 stop:2698 length:705 start_codon:yes stop_codon:yes gene_type:complete